MRGMEEAPEHFRDGRSDRTLVTEFLEQREERTFRELYRRHAPTLNQLITRLVGGSNGDAEDVIQVTWIRAIQNLPGFRWDSSLRTWLTGIALNCSREHRRAMNHPRIFELNEETAIMESPMPGGDINPFDLESAIRKLPDGFREILILHDIEGYTHEEIARLLGIQTGTSKSQLARARSAVRSALATTAEDERRGEE
jgi:RNA polymerase sigma-70 factor (ECF subfamily)